MHVFFFLSCDKNSKNLFEPSLKKKKKNFYSEEKKFSDREVLFVTTLQVGYSLVKRRKCNQFVKKKNYSVQELKFDLETG